MNKPPAVFPGKFSPPHMGHAATITRLSKDWDLTVVVTEDTPKGAKWTQKQIADAIRHLGVHVAILDGKLTDRESSPFPEDATVLSGNPEVLEWALVLGIKCEHVDRTDGITASDMREDVEPPDDPTEGARRFWQHQTKYPEYGTIKRRRLHELNTLAPMLRGTYQKAFGEVVLHKGVESLLDVGCGDGALIRCLREVSDVENFAGCDFADNLAGDVPGFFHWDARSGEPLPKVDFVTCCGMIPFLFDDDDVRRLLATMAEAAPRAYIRAPCSMKPGAIEVAGYSEKLGENYYSKYRTFKQLSLLILEVYNLHDTGRSYPDEIESEFGTRQFWFECKI